MIPRLLVRIAGKIIARPIRRRLRHFEDACQNPEAVQTALLERILKFQVDTGYGRDHGFRTIRTVADYRRQVPIGPYDALAPYIQRMQKGESNALVADPIVHMFALTSGTTAARKLIPITPSYLAAYRNGWNIWGLKAMRDHRPIILRPIVQLAGDPEEYRTEAGIPCGNLSGLTATMQKRLIKWLYCVPSSSGKIKDATARYYVALRFSIRKQIGMLLSANPSTLVALARTMDQHKESLIRDLRDGTLNPQLELPPFVREQVKSRLVKDVERSQLLEAAVNRDGALLPSAVWSPERTLIGTWTGGSVGPYLRQLSKYYANTPIRDLGLLASEGRMTLPMDDDTPAGVLDITSHYFEFVPESEMDRPNPTVLGAHELQDGQSYFILPTTMAGLYRYHISDLVRVNGFFHRTPKLEFLGMGNRFANLTGEKLSEHQVTQAMESVMRRTGQPVTGYSLAPCWDEARPYYGVFMEECDWPTGRDPRSFLAALESALSEQNIEYDAKRQSSRLGPVRLLLLPTGTWSKWDRDRVTQTGGSPEQYKHPCLIPDPKFRESVSIEEEIICW